MTTAATAAPRAGKLLGQSAILFLGYFIAQAMSFGRNAILGHMLSKGDFGVAAALTVLLQAFDTISDLAVDRMIVQAEDGDDPKLLAGAHTLSIARGLVLGLVLYLVAPFASGIINIEGGAALFAVLALVPVIKGFAHLDNRVAQRRLDNRPAMLVEIGPQALAFATTLPLLLLLPDGRVAALAALVQSLATVVVSHLLARTRYRLGFDRIILKRFLRFGWPILLSALPVLIVYQGDRLIVGSFLGMEALAAYTTAFLIAMVPGTLASKAAVSLMLPVLAPVAKQPEELERRFGLLSESMILVAGLYLLGLTFLGGHLVVLAFGDRYAGAGLITATLALMWSLRMIQAPAGALLMATGDTRPLLIAAICRCLVLGLTLAVAASGANLVLLAVTGAFGEFLSLTYIGWALSARAPRLGAIVATRSAVIASAAILMTAAMLFRLTDQPLLPSILAVVLIAPTLLAAAALILPGLRRALVARVRSGRSVGRISEA